GTFGRGRRTDGAARSCHRGAARGARGSSRCRPGSPRSCRFSLGGSHAVGKVPGCLRASGDSPTLFFCRASRTASATSSSPWCLVENAAIGKIFQAAESHRGSFHVLKE